MSLTENKTRNAANGNQNSPVSGAASLDTNWKMYKY